MTKEEREKAIDLLDNLLGMVADNQDNDYDKALKMGIESLRREPCADAVSRKAIVEMLNARGQGSVMTFDHFIELLYKLPSVEPTQNWIPCSERLPEKNMACLVSVGKLNFRQIAMYSDLMGIKDHKIFYQGTVGYADFEDITEKVNAWMPLPKPYKTETESNDGN